MLEPAAAAKIDDKCVIFVIKFAKYLIGLVNDLCDIHGELWQVVIALAGHDDAVPLAVDVKRDLLKIADLERRIIKNVVILSSKCVRLALDRRQTGRDTPIAVGRNPDGQLGF